MAMTEVVTTAVMVMVMMTTPAPTMNAVADDGGGGDDVDDNSSDGGWKPALHPPHRTCFHRSRRRGPGTPPAGEGASGMAVGAQGSLVCGTARRALGWRITLLPRFAAGPASC